MNPDIIKEGTRFYPWSCPNCDCTSDPEPKDKDLVYCPACQQYWTWDEVKDPKGD